MRSLAHRISRRAFVSDRLGAVEGSAGSDGVDLLTDGLRRWTDRGPVVGDAVAVAVGGDGAGGAPPCRLLFLAPRCRAEVGHPRFPIGESATEDGVGASLDQLTALVQSLPHAQRAVPPVTSVVVNCIYQHT